MSVVSVQFINVKWNGKLLGSFTTDEIKTVKDLQSKIQSLVGIPQEGQKLLLQGRLLRDSNTRFSEFNGPKLEVLLMGSVMRPVAKIDGVSQGSSPEQSPDQTSQLPIGLKNIGNTCYLNAALQMLLNLPEFNHNLKEGKNFGIMRSVALDMNIEAGDSKTPLNTIQYLRSKYPQFGEKDSSGENLQQDSEECFQLLLEEVFKSQESFRDLFLIGTRSELTCSGTGEQREIQGNLEKLACHINSDTSTTLECIRNGVKEKLSIYSEHSSMNEDFEKITRIQVFPQYVIVNFIRFFWKSKEAIRAKILKRIDLPTEIDLTEFASTTSLADGGLAKYSLKSVVTHIGRSADSGHYIAWVKREDSWYKVDDDKVSVAKESDIISLSGGRDWHIAYYCLFEKIN